MITIYSTLETASGTYIDTSYPPKEFKLEISIPENQHNERKRKMLNYRKVEENVKNLEEKVKRLEKENVALKNRCFATTQGTMCKYCDFECNGRFGELNRDE